MTKGVGGSTAAQQLAEIAPWPDPPWITREERLARIEKARRLMPEAGCDALLVGAGASLRYFTGVSWGATERLLAMLLPASGPLALVCPAFELGSLEAELDVDAELRLWQEDESPTDFLAQALRESGLGTLIVDPRPCPSSSSNASGDRRPLWLWWKPQLSWTRAG